jgi:hypothetical protein
MSLLLNGSKTMTIAGTEMQCLEIYTGEAYTLPIAFVDSVGNAINCTLPANWTINASAKFYTVDNVSYPTPDTVELGNLNLNNTQPNSANYTLVANFTNRAAGTAYLYIGNNITNNPGNNVPTVNLANSGANSTLVIVTVDVTSVWNANASFNDINKEPLGFIVRYQ